MWGGCFVYLCVVCIILVGRGKVLYSSIYIGYRGFELEYVIISTVRHSAFCNEGVFFS